MPKLSAKTYRITSKLDRKTVIEFNGSDQRFEIEIPTIALMGFAHAVRKAAHDARIPLSKRSSTSPRSLSGPNLPPLEDVSGNMPHGSQFGLEISADFEVINAWFNIPNAVGGGGVRMDVGLTLADAKSLAADLGKAITIAKSRPSASRTKH